MRCDLASKNYCFAIVFSWRINTSNMCPYVSMFMMFVALWSVLNQRSPRGRSHIGPNTRQTQPWQRISKSGSGAKKNPKHPQNCRYVYSFNSTSASCALEDSATFTHVYTISDWANPLDIHDQSNPLPPSQDPSINARLFTSYTKAPPNFDGCHFNLGINSQQYDPYELCE